MFSSNRLLLILITNLLLSGVCLGQGADVIVGDLPGISAYGQHNGVFAYSVGTTSCNIGDVPLQWIANNNRHPVIGQNLYRLKNNRFEQIGMSWLKHGFTALQGGLCGTCFANPNGTALGVGCSDPYSASLNGNQSGLGPRSEINASTGVYPYPPFLNPPILNLTSRRLQVHQSDIDPAQNPAAQYFIEGHYVAFDDAQAGNHHNNASYRQVSVNQNSLFSLSTSGGTIRQQGAIYAWAEADPSVTLSNVIVEDGLFVLGTKVSDLGNGMWEYEYALYNMNSDRSAQTFSVPTISGLNIQNTGFHDVDYHSSEPYSNIDWQANLTANSVSWSTESYANNQNANALRWSSLYNFRFQADAAPAPVLATIGLFKPGAANSAQIHSFAPAIGLGNTPSISQLNCAVNNQNVSLSWSNGASYDSISVFRNGVQVASLAGSATSYSEFDLPIDSYDYSLNAIQANQPSQATTCTVDVLAPPAATSFTCTGNATSVQLSWVNNAAYDFIQLRRNGEFVANLAGNESSFLDTPLVAGVYEYRWLAESNGILLDFVFCTATVAVPTYQFTLSAPSISQTYDSQGQTSFALGISLEEESTSPGFPNQVEGFSLEFSHDNTYLSATAVNISPSLAALNNGSGPDYFVSELASNGISCGMIFSFNLMGNLQFDTASQLIEVEYEGVAPNLIGAGQLELDFEFRSEEIGSPPVETLIVVGAFGVSPSSLSGHVSLSEFQTELSFIRADTNDDGNLNIADVLAALAFLFSGQTLPCHKAADFNDDGSVNLGDPIGMLTHLFNSGATPGAPFPSCGLDPTADALSCLGPLTSCP